MEAEKLARTAGVAGIGLYAIGLLGVNAYLLPFGATEFNLVKPQSIYTGVLVLLPLAIGVLGVETVRMTMMALSSRAVARAQAGGAVALLLCVPLSFTHRPIPLLIISAILAVCLAAAMRRRRRWWDIVRPYAAVLGGGGVIGVALLGATLWAVGGARHLKAFGDADRIILVFLLMLTVLGVAPGSVRRRLFPRHTAASIPAAGDDPGFSGSPLGVQLLVALVTLLLFSQYLGRFADDVYPVFPRQFGGGSSTKARFLFSSPDAAEQAARLGIVVDDRASSDELEIIFEGSDFYLLCFPHTRAEPCISDRLRAVRLDKKLVSAVTVESKGR